MMTWTPEEWGTAAFLVSNAVLGSYLIYQIVLAMFGGLTRPEYNINLTVTQDTTIHEVEDETR